MQTNKIMHGDCLIEMENIDDKSIDMIFCDLPYGVSKCKFDCPIPFDKMWNHYHRIIKDNGAILLFGQGLFSAKLILSNEKYYRYTLIWEKTKPTGFLNARKMPLKSHEDILMFYKKLPTYNPQMEKGTHYTKKHKTTEFGENFDVDSIRKRVGTVFDNKGLRFPKSVIKFNSLNDKNHFHPHQKPLDLCQYLIKTFTNPDDLVLDNVLN